MPAGFYHGKNRLIPPTGINLPTLPGGVVKRRWPLLTPVWLLPQAAPLSGHRRLPPSADGGWGTAPTAPAPGLRPVGQPPAPLPRGEGAWLVEDGNLFPLARDKRLVCLVGGGRWNTFLFANFATLPKIRPIGIQNSFSYSLRHME